MFQERFPGVPGCAAWLAAEKGSIRPGDWVYGLLLVAWGLYDLLTGESVFVQRITRRRQPVTYWLVVLTWILFGVLWIVYGA